MGFSISCHVFFLRCLSLKGIVCGDGMVQCDEEGLLDECMVCSDQKRSGTYIHKVTLLQKNLLLKLIRFQDYSQTFCFRDLYKNRFFYNNTKLRTIKRSFNVWSRSEKLKEYTYRRKMARKSASSLKESSKRRRVENPQVCFVFTAHGRVIISQACPCVLYMNTDSVSLNKDRVLQLIFLRWYEDRCHASFLCH
jgi:hypothetical protein